MPSKLNLKHDMAFKSVFGADTKESQIALCSLLSPFSNNRFLLLES